MGSRMKVVLSILIVTVLVLQNAEETQGGCTPTGTTSGNTCPSDTPCCSSSGYCGYKADWCADGLDRREPRRYTPKGYGEQCWPGDTCAFGLSCKDGWCHPGS